MIAPLAPSVRAEVLTVYVVRDAETGAVLLVSDDEGTASDWLFDFRQGRWRLDGERQARTLTPILETRTATLGPSLAAS